MRYVFGVAVGVDLTRRDLQLAAKKAGRPWDCSKGFDFSAPVGAITPLITAAFTAKDYKANEMEARREWKARGEIGEKREQGDFVPMEERAISLSVDGQVRQEGKLGDMVWSIADMISRLSEASGLGWEGCRDALREAKTRREEEVSFCVSICVVGNKGPTRESHAIGQRGSQRSVCVRFVFLRMGAAFNRLRSPVMLFPTFESLTFDNYAIVVTRFHPSSSEGRRSLEQSCEMYGNPYYVPMTLKTRYLRKRVELSFLHIVLIITSSSKDSASQVLRPCKPTKRTPSLIHAASGSNKQSSSGTRS